MYSTKKKICIKVNNDMRRRLVDLRPRNFYPVGRIATKIVTDFLQIYNIDNLPDISEKKKDRYFSLKRAFNMWLERSDYKNLENIAKAQKIKKQHLVRAILEDFFKKNGSLGKESKP